LPIFFVFGQFWLFFTKKDQNGQNKKIFFDEFSFVGKHLHTKFMKILSNGLDIANFLYFWSVLAVFLPKETKI